MPQAKECEAVAAAGGAEDANDLKQVLDALFQDVSEPYLVVRAGTGDPRMKIIGEDGQDRDETCFAMGTIDSFLDLELCEVVHDSDNEPRERKRGQLKVTFKGVDQDLSTCACGTEFPLDAAYCRRCGKAAPPADVTSKLKLGVFFQCPDWLSNDGASPACSRASPACSRSRPEDPPHAEAPQALPGEGAAQRPAHGAAAGEPGVGDSCGRAPRSVRRLPLGGLSCGCVAALLAAAIAATVMLTAPPLRKVPADGRGPAPPPPPQSGDAAEELRRLGQQLREQRAQAEAARADADSARGELRRAQEAAAAAQAKGEARLREAEAELRHARAELQEARAAGDRAAPAPAAGGPEAPREASARAGLGGPAGLFNALPGQRALALLIGTASACSLMGPDSFARVGVASAGILLSSLLAAGSAGCFAFVGAQQREPCLMNGVAALAGGGAPVGGYIMWLGLLAIGIWRWVTGFSIVLFAVADEVSPLEVQRAHLALCRVEEEEVPMGTWQRDAPPLERPLLTLQSTQGSPWLPRIGRFRDPEGQMVQVM